MPSPCRVVVSFGQESSLYSFPNGHPLNNSRIALFGESLQRFVDSNNETKLARPVTSSEDDLLLFHSKDYIDFVKASSKTGIGFLDYGDTPSFIGVYEASLYTVGSTLDGFRMIMDGKCDHFFNPVGGLHHSRRDRAGGFCVFNDAAVTIARSLKEANFSKVAYVDIDAHHGDGVFYGYEDDIRVIIGDIHEDGRYLYPGTGHSSETGSGLATGTKLNVPLAPSSGDEEFMRAFDTIERFLRRFEPQFIFFQCGADGLVGDPLTHLSHTAAAHRYAAKRLHKLAHEACEGRLLAMGGGGYNPDNVKAAWMAVVEGLNSGNVF